MTRIEVRALLSVLRRLLSVRLGWHAQGRWGWVVYANGEAAEWHRRLSDAVRALCDLEKSPRGAASSQGSLTSSTHDGRDR